MSAERYNGFAILLHWLMALLILALLGLGIYLDELPKGSAERGAFIALHKSLGLTAALLVIIRLFWRLFKRPPALPDVLATWQKKAAHYVHSTLYFFMFIQPVSGYLSSSFSGYKTHFWGISLPHWGWKSPPLNELFSEIHEISSVCLLLLICLHITGFLYHIYLKQYEITKRMWPF